MIPLVLLPILVMPLLASEQLDVALLAAELKEEVMFFLIAESMEDRLFEILLICFVIDVEFEVRDFDAVWKGTLVFCVMDLPSVLVLLCKAVNALLIWLAEVTADSAEALIGADTAFSMEIPSPDRLDCSEDAKEDNPDVIDEVSSWVSIMILPSYAIDFIPF